MTVNDCLLLWNCQFIATPQCNEFEWKFGKLIEAYIGTVFNTIFFLSLGSSLQTSAQ